MALLFERRPGVRKEVGEDICKKAREHLQALRKGENVFGLAANIAAGTQELVVNTTAVIESLNLMPNRMDPFFPGVVQRMPNPYQ